MLVWGRAPSPVRSSEARLAFEREAAEMPVSRFCFDLAPLGSITELVHNTSRPMNP
jgi:hypothetical protein